MVTSQKGTHEEGFLLLMKPDYNTLMENAWKVVF